MKLSDSASPPPAVRTGAWLGIAIVLAICLLDVIGWLFGVPVLTSVRSGWTAMRAITALCLTAAALAVALVHEGPSAGVRSLVSRVLGALVGLIGLFSIAVYVLLMATPVPAAWAETPVFHLFLATSTRMALLTAVLFLATGVAAVLLAAKGNRAAGVAHVLMLPVAVVSYVVPVSYVLGVQSIHELLGVPVAMNTGIAFCALCFAFFCARPDTWLMAAFTGNQAGSAMARRLLPALLPLPVLIGWLRLYGEHSGIFQSDAGVVLVAITYSFCLAGIVWFTARSIARTDERRQAAERNLRASEQRWATTLTSIGDAVIATDRARRVAFLNPVAEGLTGWTSTDAIGKPLSEVFHIVNEHTRLPVDDPVAKVLAEGRVIGLANHTVLVRKDETEVAIDDSGAPIREEDGVVTGAVLVFRDITDRRQAEAALRDSECRERERATELAVLLDAVPTPVFIARDPDCIHLAGNRAADDLLRLPRGTEASLSAPDDRKPSHFKAVKDGRELRTDELPAQRAARGVPVRDFDFDLVFQDGVVRHVVGYGTPLADDVGQPRGAVQVLVDITDRKRAEEKVRLLNTDLEMRVAERTAEAERRAEQLRALAAELVRVEERERRRLAQVLHDGLQQLLVAAKMRAGSACTEARGQERIEKALSDVADLLKQAIDSSRSLTAELSPPALYDAGLPAALGWLARWMEEKHGLSVAVQADEKTDPASLESRILLFQGARELLFNAAKHANVDSASVTLSRNNGDIRLEIADLGQGFDPAEKQKDGQTGGFGLFSLRERVEPMGGHMFIDSAPGAGTRIVLAIPDAPVGESNTTRVCQEGVSRPVLFAPGLKPSASIRVLVVDDHAIVRQGLAGMISSEDGIEVVGEAGDGLEAVSMARSLHPDTIVMDVNMPRMNGLDATRAIVAEMPDVKVIGLSVHEKNDMEEKMREAGAWAYMDKSGPGEDLIAAIRACRAV